MRFDKLDLNLLVALDALLAERNISRAAEKLFLSQSAMSSALGRLRDYFGDELLVPVRRRMELTPRALSLQAPVRDILVRIRATIAAQPGFDPTQPGRLFNIIASDYSLDTVMPAMNALAASQGSLSSFRFHPVLTSPARALESGDADLLMIPQPYLSPDHPSEPLMTEEFVCVVWRGSRHAREGLTRESYMDAGHVVMVAVEHGAQGYESRFMERSGVERRIAVATYSFASMPKLVLGTPYIATVHRRLAQRMARRLPLTVLPSPVEIPVMQLMMQWHEFRSRDPGLVWLRERMHEAVARLDAEGLDGF
ncbi:MAG: LysR family transcriptional regulator [Porticoccaceae bacterium]